MVSQKIRTIDNWFSLQVSADDINQKSRAVADPTLGNKDRLGHSTLAMTERYAHLAPSNSQRTVATLENFLSQSRDWEVIDLNR
jgi:hypothetical protein